MPTPCPKRGLAARPRWGHGQGGHPLAEGAPPNHWDSLARPPSELVAKDVLGPCVPMGGDSWGHPPPGGAMLPPFQPRGTEGGALTFTLSSTTRGPLTPHTVL